MEMRPVCEKCKKELPQDGIAFVCSYECTFCEDCTKAMENVCPNCKGELVRRPRRKNKPKNNYEQTTPLRRYYYMDW